MNRKDSWRRRQLVAGLVPAIAIAISSSSIATAGSGFWTSGGPYGGTVDDLAVDPASPSTLYAATRTAGVFKSTDSGATWTAANTGLTMNTITDLEIDPVNPTTVYAGAMQANSNRVFRSTNSGGTWAVTGFQSPTPYAVRALAIDPSTPTTLYAAGASGAFKSTDSGGQRGGPIPRHRSGESRQGLRRDVSQLGVLPGRPSREPTLLYAGTGSSVFRSTNSGGTWATTDTGLDGSVSVIGIDPATPANLYAATISGFGVFKSTDSGGAWAMSSMGLTDPNVISLDIDPLAPSTLYVGTGDGGGAFKSTDSAATWVNTGLRGPPVRALVIDPGTPSTLIAGTDPAGVFRSTDAGGSWRPESPAWEVRAVALDPAGAKTLYVGLEHGGVWQVSGDPSSGYGDLDQSGARDVLDVVTLASFLVGNIPQGAAPFLAPRYAADLNRDGVSDLLDLVLLQAFLAGNVARLPVSSRSLRW